MLSGRNYRLLSEVCHQITDGSHNPPIGVEFSDYPMLSSKNIGFDKLDYTTPRYLTKEQFDTEDKRTNVSEGDVLITIVGTIGRACCIKAPFQRFTLQRSVAVLKPRIETIMPRYLMYCLTGLSDYFEKEAKGVAQKGVYLKQLAKVPIPVPSLREQKCIVSELDLLSGIIDKFKSQLKELDTLAIAVFHEMFGDPIENEKRWDVKQVGEIGTIVSGSTPSTTDESNWDGTVNWVTPAELGEQLYYGETERKISEQAAKRLTLMPVGTVLLSSRAPIGKLAISTVPMCCNQGFKNIICSKIVNNVFLYFYLLLTMDNIKALGRGATFKEVSKQAISAYNVIIPPIPLQQSFADKVQVIEQQKETINKAIKEAQTLFDYTMDKYFG